MSPRIDFYLLESANEDASLLFICRLLEKVYLKGHSAFVYCKDRQEAEQVDELLWTFKDNSFIPHNLQGEGPEPPPPIQLGCGSEPRGFNDILLNLSAEIPVFYSRFQRIIEIVANNEREKELGRMHYKLYRQDQCEVYTHEIKALAFQ